MRLRRIGVAAGTVLAVVASVSPVRAYDAADQQRLIGAFLTAREAAAVSGIPGELRPAWPLQCDERVPERLTCQIGYFGTAPDQAFPGNLVLAVHESGQYAASYFEASVKFDLETAGAQEVPSADGSRHLTYFDAPEFTRVEGLIHRGRLMIRVRCSGDVAKERLVSCADAGLDAQLAKLETVFPSVVPPAQPSKVDAQVFRDRAIVSWFAPGNDGGDAELTYSVTSTPPGAGCQTAETTCTIRGLIPGTSYTFTVVATNSAGPSGAVTSPRAKRASLPSGPVRNASAARRGSVVRVTWKAPAVTGGVPVLRYEVRSTPAGGTCETRSTACDITGLAPGREYRFTVVARNAAGVSRKVMTQTVRIPVPPPVPTPVPLPAPAPDKPTATFS